RDDERRRVGRSSDCDHGWELGDAGRRGRSWFAAPEGPRLADALGAGALERPFPRPDDAAVVLVDVADGVGDHPLLTRGEVLLGDGLEVFRPAQLRERPALLHGGPHADADLELRARCAQHHDDLEARSAKPLHDAAGGTVLDLVVDVSCGHHGLLVALMAPVAAAWDRCGTRRRHRGLLRRRAVVAAPGRPLGTGTRASRAGPGARNETSEGWPRAPSQ